MVLEEITVKMYFESYFKNKDSVCLTFEVYTVHFVREYSVI